MGAKQSSEGGGPKSDTPPAGGRDRAHTTLVAPTPAPTTTTTAATGAPSTTPASSGGTVPPSTAAAARPRSATEPPSRQPSVATTTAATVVNPLTGPPEDSVQSSRPAATATPASTAKTAPTPTSTASSPASKALSSPTTPAATTATTSRPSSATGPTKGIRIHRFDIVASGKEEAPPAVIRMSFNATHTINQFKAAFIAAHGKSTGIVTVESLQFFVDREPFDLNSEDNASKSLHQLNISEGDVMYCVRGKRPVVAAFSSSTGEGASSPLSSSGRGGGASPHARSCTEYRKGMDGLFHCNGRCGITSLVWGSGPLYTADSAVCRAARHNGLIGERGFFVVTKEPGQASYRGSAANGVTTSDWARYDLSIRFSRAPANAVAPPSSGVDTAVPSSGPGSSSTARRRCNEYRKGMQGWFHCSGQPACGSSGTVWGSAPDYTADSCVCLAARHAGVIPAGGGAFFVTTHPGLPGYVASTSNGITTQRWASYDLTIHIASAAP